MLFDKQTNFENHHHQKYFYCGNNLNQMPEISQHYHALLLVLLLLANVARFVFMPEFFTRLDILDLLTNSFCFIFASSMSLVNLLKSKVVMCFPSISNILVP